MAHVSELLPIVVDPNHQRFGQIGQLIAADQEFGDHLVEFEDGEQILLNDGWTTGVPQFVAPYKDHEAGVRRLQGALPGMRASLLPVWLEKLQNPYKVKSTKSETPPHAQGLLL